MNLCYYLFVIFICVCRAQVNTVPSGPLPGKSSDEIYQKKWEKYYENIRDSKEEVNLLAAVGSPLPSDVRPVTGPFGKLGRPAIEFTPQSYVGRFAKDIVPVPFFFNFGIKVTLFLQSLHGGVIFSLLKPDHSEILLSVTITKADNLNQNIEFIYQNGDDVFKKKTFKAVFTLPKFERRWVIFSIVVKAQTVTLYYNGCERIFEKTFKRTRTPIKMHPRSPLFIGMAGWYIKKPVLFGALYDLILMKNHEKAIPSCANNRIEELKKAKDYKSKTKADGNRDMFKNTSQIITQINNDKNKEGKSTDQNNKSENSDTFFTKVESNEILSGPQIPNTVHEEESKIYTTATSPHFISTSTDPRTAQHKSETNPHYVTTVAPYTRDKDATTVISLYPTTTTTQHPVDTDDLKEAKDLINRELEKLSKTIEETSSSHDSNQEENFDSVVREKKLLREVKSEIVSTVVKEVTQKINKDHCKELMSRENIESIVTKILHEKEIQEKKRIEQEKPKEKTSHKSNANSHLQANIIQTKQDLDIMADMFPMGSFVFVSSSNQLFIKSINDWLEILTTKPSQAFQNPAHGQPMYGPDTNSYALHDHQVYAPNEQDVKLLQSNLILPPAGVIAKRPYLILAALNDPLSGYIGGIGRADYMCYKQARKAGLSGGNFRAFLADRYQEIKHLVSSKFSHLPVANFQGDQLFESYSTIYNTSKYRAFNPKIPIYSFDTHDVRTSSKWPIKKFWHGSLANGENNKAQSNCKNWRSNSASNKGYSTSLVSILPALNEGAMRCDQKLIVLCIEVTVR